MKFKLSKPAQCMLCGTRSLLEHLAGAIDALGLEAVFLIIMDSIVHLLIALVGLAIFVPNFLYRSFAELIGLILHPRDTAQRISDAYERFAEGKKGPPDKKAGYPGISFWSISEGTANAFILRIWESVIAIAVIAVSSGMFAMLAIVRTIGILIMGSRWLAFTIYWHLTGPSKREGESSTACA